MCILHNFCLDEGYSIEDVDVSITDQEANGFVCIRFSRYDGVTKNKE